MLEQIGAQRVGHARGEARLHIRPRHPRKPGADEEPDGTGREPEEHRAWRGPAGERSDPRSRVRQRPAGQHVVDDELHRPRLERVERDEEQGQPKDDREAAAARKDVPADAHPPGFHATNSGLPAAACTA